MITDTFAQIVQVFTTSGMPLRYGTMLGMSVIVGFILYEYRSNWRWVFAWLAFAMLHAWMVLAVCYNLFDACMNVWNTVSFALIVISVVLFGIGSIVGMLLASRFAQKREQDIKACKLVYQDIKVSNGLLAKDSRNSGGSI